jgi:hypothetical protein
MTKTELLRNCCYYKAQNVFKKNCCQYIPGSMKRWVNVSACHCGLQVAEQTCACSSSHGTERGNSKLAALPRSDKFKLN